MTPQRDRRWPYVLLFLATCYTTTAAGAEHYVSFYLGFSGGPNPFSTRELLIYGLWYSVPILRASSLDQMCAGGRAEAGIDVLAEDMPVP